MSVRFKKEGSAILDLFSVVVVVVFEVYILNLIHVIV